MFSPFLPESDKVAALREALPATRAGLYLNAGTCGPLPAETARAMEQAAARELAVGRAAPSEWLEHLARLDEARAGFAAALVADPDDIALTHATTEGMALALAAIPWRRGDRVITTNHEHPAALGFLVALRERLGVQIDTVDIGDADPDAVVDGVARALAGPGGPARAVVASHVTWTTGARLPVERIGQAAHAAGAFAVVDGAQSAGAIGLVLDDMPVDAYAVPGQKWLLGPEGMGALWVCRGFAEAMTPASPTGLGFARFSLDDPVFRSGARRFEATGFHRPSVIGMARSLGWLAMYVGLPWAQERANRLAAAFGERLAGIAGVTVLTPRPVPATLVSFRIAGWTGTEAAAELGPRTLAVLRDIAPLDAVRVSVGFWTTEAELERVAAAVELLARHTPGTVPSRRLAVLDAEGRPLG